MQYDYLQGSQLSTREELVAVLEAPARKPAMPKDAAEFAALKPAQRSVLNDHRLDYLSRGPIVATPRISRLVRNTRLRMVADRHRPNGRGGIWVSGEALAGKTTACIAIARSVYDWSKSDTAPERFARELPVAFVNVPSPCTPKSMMQRFAAFLGIAHPESWSMEQIQRVVVQQLRALNTKLVIVDELHNLSTVNRGHGEVVDMLKGMLNEISATFVFAGIMINQSNILSGSSGMQLAGRFQSVNLSDYELASDTERVEWATTIASLQANLPLLGSGAPLVAHAEWLHERTLGRMGLLSRLLTDAAIVLIDAAEPENEVITLDLLEDLPMPMAADDDARWNSTPKSSTRKRSRARAA